MVAWRREIEPLVSRIIQHPADDLVGPMHRLRHVLEELSRRLVGISEAFRQHLDAGQDHHERVLDLVGHSGGHPAKRVELLRLDQLQLRGPEFGLVSSNLAEPARAQRNRDVRGDDKQDEKRAADQHVEVQGQEVKDSDGDEADAKEDRHDGPAPVVRQQERGDEGKAPG